MAGAEGIGTLPNDCAPLTIKWSWSHWAPVEILYSSIMYRIGRDHTGPTLVCRACTHSERVQDFNGSFGNPRTLAAHAMLKHAHAEHSRETHLRAMAMVMERHHAPR